MSTPKVSVCVITFNHEKYIAKCLQSIVEQNVEFGLEILVGDDCSTDSTREIIREFAAKYPRIIKPVFPEEKIGGTRNYLQVHELAQGEYIAHVDGDDYILPGKLSSQVSILDSDSTIALAAHAVNRIDTEDSVIGQFGNEAQLPVFANILAMLDLGTYFTNSSIMYRKNNRFPHDWGVDYVDFYFHLEQASKGKVFLDKRIFGCYRTHGAGTTRNPAFRDLIEQCYEQAFDRAESLGVQKGLVEKARFKRRMGFAIARYLSGDIGGYRKNIKLRINDFRYASPKHIFLNFTKRIPRVINWYFTAKEILNA